MEKIINLDLYQRIHLIGVGGISMSAIAKYLVLNGKTVSGSDRTQSETLLELKKLGVKVFDKHGAKNVVGADAVIYTSAVDQNNPELKKAKDLGIEIFTRSQVLGYILSRYSQSVAVSGSHGKTTTTCMISEILLDAGYNPTVFAGGESVRFGNFRYSCSDYAVVEACEYKKNFLELKPFISVVLNIDDDHLDTYGSVENEIKTFSKFCENSLCVINKDDKNANSIKRNDAIYYSTCQNASVRAKYIKANGNGYSFSVYVYGVRAGRINLKVKGKYNLYNALASICVCVQLGVPFKYIKSGLENYAGVKRRNEYVGKICQTPVYSDYAHHPSEINATLEDIASDDLVVFQPHTYSRTRLLMNDFVRTLSGLKNLIIYKTYPAREKKDEIGSAYTLYKNLRKASDNVVLYSDDEKSLCRYLRAKSTKFRKIIFVGAGDIYEIAKKIVNC